MDKEPSAWIQERSMGTECDAVGFGRSIARGTEMHQATGREVECEAIVRELDLDEATSCRNGLDWIDEWWNGTGLSQAIQRQRDGQQQQGANGADSENTHTICALAVHVVINVRVH